MENITENDLSTLTNNEVSDPIIKIDHLVKYYNDVKALNIKDLKLEKKRIIGLVGPNGSGKTTLIKILAGLIKNFNGKVYVNEKEVGVETKSLVSYLPDINFLPDEFDYNDACNYYSDFYKDFNKNKAMDIATSLGLDPKRKFKTLSKGNKEKVQLILCLSREASLYLFDEPIAGVDPATRDFIFKLILDNYNKDASILISTHLISEAETIFDDVVFLNKGNVILYNSVKSLVEFYGKTINDIFREVYKW